MEPQDGSWCPWFCSWFLFIPHRSRVVSEGEHLPRSLLAPASASSTQQAACYLYEAADTRQGPCHPGSLEGHCRTATPLAARKALFFCRITLVSKASVRPSPWILALTSPSAPDSFPASFLLPSLSLLPPLTLRLALRHQ